MTFPIIPDKWKNLWDLWDIRVAVLLSLSYQILLISIAPLRKRTGNIFLTVFVWSSYLLADWVATFALGLIASGLNECGKPALDQDLITFWAPFLLVHLGGPHSITAFSLEDNELWLRHLLQLIIHLLLVAYVFTQSIPNGLWIPISLVYLAGFIKYFERTRSLYLASLASLKTSTLPKPTAGSNYVRRLMQVYESKNDASIPVDIILPEATEVDPEYSVENCSEFEVVQSGYRFFNDFKGLIVDLTYGHHEWQRSRHFFFKTSPKDAFRIMEVELNFLYDMLYTKMVVVHRKWGFASRFVCLGCIVLALERFVSHHHMNHTHIHEVDIYITYTLIMGAIGLDFFAIIKLIFSDWTIAKPENFQSKVVLRLVLFIRKTISLDGKCRWSNSLSQHSLITYCLKEQFKWIEKLVYHFGAMDFLDEILYKNTVHVENDNDLKVLKWIKKAVKCNFRAKEAETVNGDRLKKFIFEELRDKALKAKTSKDAKEMCSWRGERPLLQASRFSTTLAESVEVEYDESVLRWHVATELCYHTKTEGEDDKDEHEHRQFCKILSEYMLYLLIMRPTMMSEVTGIVHFIFQDTCKEAKKFFVIGKKPTREAQGEVGKLFRNIMEAIKKFFRFPTTPKEEANLESENSGNKQEKHEESSNSRSRQEKQQVPTPKEAKKFFGSGQEPTGNNMEAIKKFHHCSELLKVDTVIAPGKVKGGTSKSVLFDACIMAKDLKKLDAKERWEIMSKVWVELLCYAASHCKAHAHAKQLSKGGEFITFVWLLMIHFGMGEPFREDPESSRYKVVVTK